MLNIYSVISLKVLPFTDLPNHLSAATVVKYYDEPGNEFKKFYDIPDKIKSNTFHLYFTSSSLFPTVEFGNKIYYILYVILFPLSILAVIKKLKGDIRYSLFSFFFLWNFEVSFGFVGYTLSVPFLILLILFLVDFFETPTYKYTFYLMILNVLLFFIHFQQAIYALVILFVFSLINYKTFFKNIFKKIIAIIPVLILMVISYTSDASEHYESLFPYLFKYYTSDFWLMYYQRFIDLFVLENFFWIPETPGLIFTLLFSIFIFLPLIIFLFKKRNEILLISLESNNKYFLIFGIISLVLFFILPDNIPGQNIIYQRFLIFVMLVSIILLSVFSCYINMKKYFLIGIILLCVHTAVSFNYFSDFKKESRFFTEDIFPKENNHTLAGLMFDAKFRNSYVYIHFQNYYTIWNKGITANGNLDYRYSFIRRKKEVDMNILPPHNAWVDIFKTYNPPGYKDVDYLLTRDSTSRPFENFQIIRSSGDWHLYENILKSNK